MKSKKWKVKMKSEKPKPATVEIWVDASLVSLDESRFLSRKLMLSLKGLKFEAAVVCSSGLVYWKPNPVYVPGSTNATCRLQLQQNRWVCCLRATLKQGHFKLCPMPTEVEQFVLRWIVMLDWDLQLHKWEWQMYLVNLLYHALRLQKQI